MEKQSLIYVISVLMTKYILQNILHWFVYDTMTKALYRKKQL